MLSKIWLEPNFIQNAGRVTNEVRLCSLKLNKDDVAKIFESFNHIKSIWFIKCELDINERIPIPYTNYQIEKFCLIE